MLEGPRVRASPASLRCGLWARHIYPSSILVQHRKTRPYINERLLMGRKKSNKQKKTSISSISNAYDSSFEPPPPHQCINKHFFLFFNDKGIDDPNTAINGPPSARQRNAFEMAFRWWADDGPTLNAGLVDNANCSEIMKRRSHRVVRL